jgi:GNAT superfamily N-acetyltransferase
VDRESGTAAAGYALRPHRPGDIGWVIQRHGEIYAAEYGWDETFEALVARIAADFIDRFDPSAEHCWIAEHGGQRLGCVFLVRNHEQAGTAQLRLLLVEPAARGLGLGKRLVRECTDFARISGYKKILLWTNSELHAARRLYEAEGYVLIKEEPHVSWGKPHVGQTWELTL